MVQGLLTRLAYSREDIFEIMNRALVTEFQSCPSDLYLELSELYKSETIPSSDLGIILYSVFTCDNGSVCQRWVVDRAPTDLRNGPINGGAVSTPLPNELLTVASPSPRHQKGRIRTLGLGCKANKLQRRRAWGPRYAANL